jgi:FixJ family two-component response regulator
VDDDDRVLQSLAGLFASMGYAVRPHSSGEALLSSGDVHLVDCLISDVGMTRMSGMELLERVLLERPTLPVILITGRREGHLSQLAGRNGARFLLEIPLDINQLIDAVKSVLRDPLDEVRGAP